MGWQDGTAFDGWMPRQEFNEYRGATIEWVTKLEPDIFLSFSFNCTTTASSSLRAIREFHKRIDRKLMGPKRAKYDNDRTLIIAFIENQQSNLHYHAFVRFTPRRKHRIVGEEWMREVWKQIIPAGDIYREVPDSMRGAVRYSTKQLRSAENTKSFVLLPY